jgi:hypothetical protein
MLILKKQKYDINKHRVKKITILNFSLYTWVGLFFLTVIYLFINIICRLFLALYMSKYVVKYNFGRVARNY